jgi:hypothetical protein
MRRLVNARLAAAVTVAVLGSSACSSAPAPESLAMADGAAVTSSIPATTATTGGPADAGVAASDPPADLSVMMDELSPEQVAVLDTCATALDTAVVELDPDSPNYTADVFRLLLSPESDVADRCGSLADPDSTVPQQVVIAFMLDRLPPELIAALSTGMTVDALGGGASAGSVPG